MKGYQKLTDSELWNLIVNDDQAAFKIAFDKYWPSLFKTAFNYLKDQEACAEIVNDIFLNIWQKRAQLQILSLKAYLSAAARYHIYKKIKLLKKSPLVLLENYDFLNEKADKSNHVEDKIKYSELESRLANHLLELPKRCREIFMLSRIEYLSNEEIATKYNISKRTVENQLTHALKHLRNCLKNLSIFFILLGFMAT